MNLTSEHLDTRVQAVRDSVLRRMLVVGRSCAADLANEIRTARNADDVIDAIRSLEAEGLVRKAKDQLTDPDCAETAARIIYELAG